MTTTISIKPAELGSISTATLRTEDLLEAFMNELDWQLRRNGEYFSRPENFSLRDKLNSLVGEAQDCFGDDGEILPEKQDDADYLVQDIMETLQEYFAPAYAYFGSHPGDGADFGFWVNIEEDVKEQVGFVSSKDQDYPNDDYRGEWLHVNDHGNCTLYVRDESGKDNEVWSVV